MDPITQQLALTSAVTDATYVDDVFSTYVYEGTGSSQTITNGIDLSGEGGMVWIKGRDNNNNHVLTDTVRGAGNYLRSNTNSAESNATNSLQSFTSTGFSVGSAAIVNNNGSAMVSWSFRKAPGFFDVVTYTGDGDISRTVSHSLGSVPGMIIVKKYSGNSGLRDWYTWHTDLGGAGKFLKLNLTASIDTNSLVFSTLPTATVFSPGSHYQTNESGQSYVAYIFAHDDARFGTYSNESIIKCGTYEGNDGTQEINLGFEPQWLMLKNADDYLGDWIMVDIMRDFEASGVSGDSESLCANLSDGVDVNGVPVNGGRVKITPRGFKFDNENNHDYNELNYTYVYMAIRRPHKPPTAGTDVFTDTGSSGVQNAGFPIDTRFSEVISSSVDTSKNFTVFDRLRGGVYLVTSTDSAELTAATNSSLIIPRNNVGEFYNHSNSRSYIFRRAPGFMDVVRFDYPSSSSAIPHNLGVAPELIIHKPLSNNQNWLVGSDYLSNTNGWNRVLHLNLQDHDSSTSTVWDQTAPTNTNFTLGSFPGSSHSGIAYLFATLSGISKVGSYSGSTGNDVDVDCDFTGGPRVVLIKRTDQNASWYFISGITAGNDSYNFLDQAVARSVLDHIDPSSNGFTIKSSAPADLNATGGTYLFLAIA